MTIDTDLLALGAMMREALAQIARLKSPANPASELLQMRQNILEDIAKSPPNTASPKAVQAAMFEAVLRLMPLDDDRNRVN